MKKLLFLMIVILVLSGCMKQIRVLTEAQKQERALREADSLRINRLDEESMQLQRRLINVDTRTSVNRDEIRTVKTKADSLQAILDYHASLLNFHTDRISTVLDVATDDAVRINDMEKRLDFILEKISSLESDQYYSSENGSNEKVKRLEQKIDELNERISYLENTGSQPKPAPKPKKVPKSNPIPISNSSPEAKKTAKMTSVPNNPSADQLYQAGRDYYDHHDQGKSLEAFVKFTNQYPNHSLLPNAYYWIAEISYDRLNFAQAAEQFQKVATMFPTSTKAPEALLKKALCYMKLNKKKEARATLVILINNYPNYVQNQLVNRLMQRTQ